MPINTISDFETTCRWFDSAAYCCDGVLHDTRTREQVILEGIPIFCSKCDGTGFVLSRAGEQLVDMVWRRLQRRILDLVREVTDKGN